MMGSVIPDEQVLNYVDPPVFRDREPAEDFAAGWVRTRLAMIVATGIAAGVLLHLGGVA